MSRSLLRSPSTNGAAAARDKVTEMARIAGRGTSPAKNSGRMDARDRVQAIEGHGLEGCAHARAGTKRQVLFAAAQHLDDLGVEYGRIRENFTVEGADV